MKLYCKEKDYTLYEGTMQEVLSSMPDNSVDAIITDPPYEISFMGKGWDATGVAYTKETWEHCFRVLKPGGYLLSFGATRTFHRIAVAIEDAGFEIRDTIMWLYGSGFPKSMNLGLAIDKKNGVESKVVARVKGSGTTGINDRGNQQFVAKNQYEDGTYDLKQAQNEWSGWGTALKPAYEPIIVARKPFKGSLVDNVLEYGVGGINIDECRVENTNLDNYDLNKRKVSKATGIENDGHFLDKLHNFDLKHGVTENGRFPANVILTYDETDFDEVCGGFPNTKSTYNKDSKHENKIHRDNDDILKYGYKERIDSSSYNDDGSASRYFYCAKASKKDRDEGLEKFEGIKTGSMNSNINGNMQLGGASLKGDFKEIQPKKNIHPTVKPVELMQYLVRLVSPKNGVVLDCFMGSGSTGKAVMFENRERNANYHFIGVEMTTEYLPICHSRIDYALNKYEYDLEKEKQEMEEIGQMSLF